MAPRTSSLDEAERADLLEKEEEGQIRELQGQRNASRQRNWLVSVFTHCLAAICAVALYSTFWAPSRRTSSHRPLSDALENVRWEVKPTRPVAIKDSIFVGGPESQADAAWSTLLGNITMKATADELSRNGDHQHSVAVSSGDDHLVWLNVFHQLHCLKKLRRINYRQFYHVNDTESESHERTIHADHCVEMLRQSVMCNPDLALTTFDWEAKKAKPTLNVNPHERRCINWEVMMDSLLPRVIDEDQMAAVVNPIAELHTESRRRT